MLNPYNIPYGHITYGSTCVTGHGGPFPTGDSLNQWIQQVISVQTYLILCWLIKSYVGLNYHVISVTNTIPIQEKKSILYLSPCMWPCLLVDDCCRRYNYKYLTQFI